MSLEIKDLGFAKVVVVLVHPFIRGSRQVKSNQMRIRMYADDFTMVLTPSRPSASAPNYLLIYKNTFKIQDYILIKKLF